MSNKNIEILIMEDRDEKINILKSLLVDECGLNESHITIAKTINAGRKNLRERYFDLLILDLVMPNLDGEEANHNDAPNFIDELYLDRGLLLPNQIIGFTGYDEEYDNLKSRFEDKLWSIIKYQAGNLEWKPKIRSKVNHLIHSKERLALSIIEEYKYDIGILCALDEESEQLRASFGNEWKTNSIESFPLPFFTKEITTADGSELKICLVSIGQAGLIPTSAIATTMIMTFHLNSIFMTGIAAGFEDREIRLGDVIVSTSINEPIIGKIIEDGAELDLRREIHNIQSDPKLLSYAQSLISNVDFISEFNQKLRRLNLWNNRDNIQIIAAPTVSVPFVVGSNKLMKIIQNKGDRKLTALDMEGFGLYQAASLLKIPCLWIKAITDLGDEHKGDSFHNICSYASGYFLYKLIKECL